jgi:histone H3
MVQNPMKQNRGVYIGCSFIKMSSEATEKQKRKRRAATNAIREIRTQQKLTNHIIPVAPFNRLVQEIAQGFKQDLRFKGEAYDAFHAAAEDHLIKMFSDANAAAIHSRRETVQPKDLKLARGMQETFV